MARGPERARPPDRTGDLFAGSEPAAPPLYSVGQLSAVIAGRLQDLGRVRVEGELSQLKRPTSGHVFFALKDQGACLSCKVWQSKVRAALRFELEEGMQVIAWGRLDLYPPQGSYSLVVEKLEPLGLGALLARLERLKTELRARGWFDRKRALPRLPRVIGLVTSRDGAALKDFLRTRSLRWPGYPLRFCHTSVQGALAAGAIADALRAIDASRVDAIALVRGGGALEDLWAFNDEVVAAAIWNASVPVVTGIGHQTDTTLADLVADHRAHTPTDAAQTLIPARAELCGRVARAGNYLVEALERALEARAGRLGELGRRPALRDPELLLGERVRALGEVHARVDSALAGHLERRLSRLHLANARLERRSPRSELARREQRLAAARSALPARALRAVERAESAVALALRGLEACSPLKVLARGFSLTHMIGEREPLLDAARLSAGDEVETRLARGSFTARVETVEAEDGPDEAGS